VGYLGVVMKVLRIEKGIMIELDYTEAENLLSDLFHYKSECREVIYPSTEELLSQLDELYGENNE
jgi:hypothetical protein